MADEEKRITAKLILDSTGFNSSLQGVNSNLKVAQSELKSASAQVGVFGKNSENLKGVQQALAAQVEQHTKKVDLYKQSLEATTVKMNANVAERDKLKSSLEKANAAYAEAVTLHGKESDQAKQAGQAVTTLTGELTKSEKAVQTNAKSINTYTTNLNKAEAELTKTQGELNKTNADLATHESRWIQTGKALDTASEKMKSTGKGMSSAGKSLSVGVTLPIVGIGVAAAKMGMDFEAQMSRVKAISQATGGEFTQLNDMALKLGADTAFSAKQAAEGMENLASAGFKTNEIMAAMPGMLNLAASGGIDIATASDIAASALRGFVLDAGQSGHVADVLAKAAADTNANVTDMGVALKYASPPAHALGMSIEEVAASIGIMSNAGIKGDMAGTTLRGSLISLASPSKEAADLMKTIGFNAFDAQGKMLPFNDVIGKLQNSTKNLTQEAKANALATIFGKESLSGMMVLMDAGPAKLDELTKSFKGSDGAAADMAKTMLDNGKGSLEAMKGSVETAAIKLSTVLAPTIIGISKSVTEMANKFSELSPGMQGTIVKTLALAAALGPIVLITGKVITAGGVIGGVLGKIAGAAGAASVAAEGTGAAVAGAGASAGAAALLLNPLTWAVVGVGAAAVGTAYLLNQKVIPAIDLFGGQVSKATEKTVTAYMDLDKKVGVSLLSFQANHTVITAAIAKDMTTTFETMGAQIKAGRDKHYTEDLANLTKFYTDQGTLNSVDAQDVLTKMKATHATNDAEVDKNQKDIAAILAKAAAEKRVLTQIEEDAIALIKAGMQTKAITALSASETEQKVIMEKAKLEKTNIATLEASEVIKQSASQRDKTIKAANDEYQGTVDALARQRAEGVPISDTEARETIAAAETKRAGAVKKAQEMHTAVVKELGNQNADVIKKLDATTGDVKTFWNNVGSWFAKHPIVTNVISQVSQSLGGKAFIPGKASGTNNFEGGLTTMHEKGYEVYNLPSGSKIYNHEASEAMITKTAQEVARAALSNNQQRPTVINFNGNYAFNNQNDIDYFMNKSAVLIQRRL